MPDASVRAGAPGWRETAILSPSLQAGLRALAGKAEIALTIFGLILFSQGLVVLFEPGVTADDQPLLRLMWYPAYLFALCMMAARPLRALHMMTAATLALVPVGLAFVSTQWSVEPDVTFRRAIALCFTTLFGVYLAMRYPWRDLLVLLGVVFFGLAAASFVAGLAFPARGVMQVEFPGVWKGVFAHKNELGSMMTRGSIVFGALLALYADARRRSWVWAGLALCVALVLISTSKTSLVATLGAGAIMLAVMVVRRGALPALLLVCGGGLAALVGGAIMLADPDLVFQMLGKDPSLTGRTDIWAALMRSIAERPRLGYGYGVFWHDPRGPAWWVREATQWQVPSAHNGWIETALSLGALGVAAAGVFVVGALVMTLSRLRSAREAAFALPYIFVTLVFSASESIILLHNNLSWVIFVAVAAKMFAGDGERPVISRRGSPPAPGARAGIVGDAGPAGGSMAVSRAPAVGPRPSTMGPRRKVMHSSLTVFRVTLPSGDRMIDLSDDLASLAAGLDRTRPADGRGRVIMFTSPRIGTGVSTLSREFARMMARRSPRGVWLFDLDLSRNTHFAQYASADARQRYGAIGPALDATLGQEPFWRVTDASAAAEGEGAPSIAALMTLHRVGGTRLFVSRFHPELLGRGQRVHVRAARPYWEKLRDTVELAVIDAPATERSFAGRPLYAEADAVVIVIDDHPDAMREAETLAESVRDRGGLPAGVIVNFAEPQATQDRRAG